MTGLEQRRMDIDAIELGASVDQIIYTYRAAAVVNVARVGMMHDVIVALG